MEMDIAITKMSSKGQVVIPAEMRKGLHEGDKLLIIKDDNKLIMKKTIKIILLIIFIFLFFGQLIFSIMQTIEAKKAREVAIHQKEIAERQRELAMEQMEIAEYLEKEVYELKEKLKNCQELNNKE